MSNPLPSLDQIKMLVERATPEPWDNHNDYLIRKCVGDFCTPIADLKTPYRRMVGLVRGFKENWANARLITLAPTLAREYVALSERAEQQSNRQLAETHRALARAEAAEQRVRVLEEALKWYGEQARLCRLIHSEGDAGRKSLADDGGKRARAALSTGAQNG